MKDIGDYTGKWLQGIWWNRGDRRLNNGGIDFSSPKSHAVGENRLERPSNIEGSFIPIGFHHVIDSVPFGFPPSTPRRSLDVEGSDGRRFSYLHETHPWLDGRSDDRRRRLGPGGLSLWICRRACLTRGRRNRRSNCFRYFRLFLIIVEREAQKFIKYIRT